MEDTWESNVSPLMMGVGMGDMRGLSELQPSCSRQDIIRDISHQNMPQHEPHPVDISQDMNSDMQDLDRDLGRELNHGIHNQQDVLHSNDYFSNHVS